MNPNVTTYSEAATARIQAQSTADLARIQAQSAADLARIEAMARTQTEIMAARQSSTAMSFDFLPPREKLIDFGIMLLVIIALGAIVTYLAKAEKKLSDGQ